MQQSTIRLIIIVPFLLLGLLLSSIPLSQFLQDTPQENDDNLSREGMVNSRQYLEPSGPSSRSVTITKGPYLQNTHWNRTTICWETDTAGWSTVEYGVTPAMGMYINDTTPRTFHEINVTGLERGTRYYYTVSTAGATSEQFSFVTAPPYNQPFRFAAYGDTRGQWGNPPANHKFVLSGMVSHDPEFILHSGDIVEEGEVQEQWQWFFDDSAYASDIFAKSTLAQSIGNHEHANNPGTWYYHYSSLPGNEQWYAFEWGNAYFIALNVQQDNDANYKPGTPQYEFLVENLAYAANESRFIFVYFHAPPYSSGHHGKDGDNGDTLIRSTLNPLFEQYGVDIVFNGHDHHYERSSANGVYYIVTGGGGAPLAPPILPYGPNSEVAVWAYHYCIIDIDGFHLDFKAIDTSGSIIDGLTIAKTNHAPRLPEVLSAYDRPNDNGEAITLNWTLSPDDGHGEHDVTEYRIYRSTSPGSTGPLLTTVPAGTSTYNDTSVMKGNDYYYSIRVFDGVQESENFTSAGPVSSLDNTPPRPPTALESYDTANDEGGSITLEWTPSPDDGSGANDVVAYELYRNDSPTGWQDITTLSVDISSLTTTGTRLSYSDTSVIDGKDYYYCLRANDGIHLSSQTNVTGPANASDNSAPSSPSGLKITDVTGSTITLTWDPNLEADVMGYEISINASHTGSAGPYVNLTTVGKVTEYTISGLKDETIYFFRLKAFDEVPNYSGFSEFKTAKTLDITPPQIPIIELPDQPLTNNPTFILEGLSEPEATLECHLNNQSYKEAYADFSGAFIIKITLREGVNRITVHAVDQAGNIGPKTGPITITLDRQAPVVTTVFPQHMNLSVVTTTTIRITFNEAIDRSSISADTVFLENEWYEKVAGTVTYDHEQYIVTFKPTVRLGYETMYTVQISALVTDVAGNPLIQPYTWSFQTMKNTAPAITSVSPAGPSEIFEGETINFSVEATDIDPLQYEWNIDSNRVNDVDGPEYTYIAPAGSAGNHEVKVKISDGILKTDHTWQVTVRSKSSPDNDTSNGDGDGDGSTPGADTRDPEAVNTETLVIILIPVAAAAGGAAITVWFLVLRRRRQ